MAFSTNRDSNPSSAMEYREILPPGRWAGQSDNITGRLAVASLQSPGPHLSQLPLQQHSRAQGERAVPDDQGPPAWGCQLTSRASAPSYRSNLLLGNLSPWQQSKRQIERNAARGPSLSTRSKFFPCLTHCGPRALFPLRLCGGGGAAEGWGDSHS